MACKTGASGGLGPNCESIGFGKEFILFSIGHCPGAESPVQRWGEDTLTNGIVLEIKNGILSELPNCPYKKLLEFFKNIFCTFFNVSPELLEPTLRKKMITLENNRVKVLKSQNRPTTKSIVDFHMEEFTLPPRVTAAEPQHERQTKRLKNELLNAEVKIRKQKEVIKQQNEKEVIDTEIIEEMGFDRGIAITLGTKAISQKELLEKRVKDADRKLEKMKGEKSGLKEKLGAAAAKISSYSPRNLKRREERMKKKELDLKECVEESRMHANDLELDLAKEEIKGKKQKEEIRSLEDKLRKSEKELGDIKTTVQQREAEVRVVKHQHEITLTLKQEAEVILQQKYEDKLAAGEDKRESMKECHKKDRRRVKYLEKKLEKCSGEKKVKNREIKDLQNLTRWLENERLEQEESIDEEVTRRMDIFLKEKTVITFENGKYRDEVRAVYQDLMCWNVGAKNVEKIVRCVLEKLGGRNKATIGRLPRPTLSKLMLLEARALAQMQCVDRILEDERKMDGVTLATDGTTKWGTKYGTYDVLLSDGTSLVMGLREMPGGAAQQSLDVLLEVTKDIVKTCGGDADESRVKVNRIIKSIKNTMSDRAATEKKNHLLLKEYRASILPQIVDGWSELTEEERKKMIVMNNFYCGLHFMVAMAEQSNTTLKVAEKEFIGSERVGSASLPGIFTQGSESGTTHLVRLTCKSVQAKACEKSGKPLDFLAYLSDVDSGKEVPLAPFKGNRFNILFHNAAGVYYLFPELLEFFTQVKDDNQLMKVVCADLNVKEYRAGCRALGLIDKIITGPLWRALNESGHIEGMNERYAVLYEKMQAWARDSTTLLKATEKLFLDVDEDRDEVFDRLVMEDDTDEICKKMLSQLCYAFGQLAKRMLSDHLEGGRFTNLSSTDRDETKSVPKTNVGTERDFGMLDRLLREKPRALTIALEGQIMYQTNNTSAWKDGLSDAVRAEVMEKARKSVKEQKRIFYERRKLIEKEKVRKWIEKRNKAEDKENRIRERTTTLTDDLVKVGGLWKSADVTKERLASMTVTERHNAVKAQLKFRKWVLGEKNKDGRLNLSEGGKMKDANELLKNLLELISLTTEETGNTHEVQEKEQETRTLKRKTRNAVEPKQKRARTTIKPGELVGRLIKHYTDDESGIEAWHVGIVTKVTRRGLFTIVYDTESASEYEFTEEQLQDDLDSGELTEVTITNADIIGRTISHMWLDEEDNEGWWTGRVIGQGDDEGEVVVDYDTIDDNDEETSEIMSVDLVSDYNNREVKLTV